MRRFGHFGGFDGRKCGVILAAFALSSASMILAPSARARQSSQGQQTLPLGTVAKQARAEKPAAPAAKKVWTNDNVPTNPSAISVVGQPLPPEEKPAAVEAKTDDKPKSSAKETPKTLTEMEAELKKQQEALALHEKEFDLSKRDAALQQQSFYANARANQDEAGQAQLAEAQKHLDVMQTELEKERAKVAELQAKVDEQKKPAAPASPGEGTGTPGGVQ